MVNVARVWLSPRAFARDAAPVPAHLDERDTLVASTTRIKRLVRLE
jgi:hypothetical protein